MATEEHCLSAVVTKAVPSLVWNVATLGVIGAHTGLIVLW